MTIIDSRKRDARGRTVVPSSDDDNDRSVVPSSDDECLTARRRAANPLTWTRYSKDVDYSISGLGSTRRFKRYPGKTFPMAAAVWRESAAEADRAAKAALAAKANANKTASGAVTSL